MTTIAAQTRRAPGAWRLSGVGAVLLVTVLAAVVGARLAGFVDDLLALPQVARYVDAISASPLIGVAGVIVLMVAVTLVWRTPTLCLYVVVGLVPFQFIGGDPGRGGVALPKLLVNGAVVGAVGIALLRYRARLTDFLATGLGLAYAWFLVTIVLGILIGLLEGYPRFDWLRESNWYCFYALALAVVALVTGWAELRRVIAVLSLATLVAQLWAFRVFATGGRYTRGEFAEFFRAPFSQSGSWMLFLTLALGVFAVARGARLRGAGWLVLSGVFALGAFLSFGRAEWAATLLGAVFTVVLVARVVGGATATAASLLFAGGIAAAAAALARATGRDLLALASLAQAFAASLVGGGDISASGRLAEVKGTVLSWQARPFGSGLGAPIAARWGMDQDPAIPYYIHNSYANTLVKLGPLGLAALVWLLYRAGRGAWEAAVASAPGSARQAVALTLLAAILKAAFLGFAVPVLSTSDAILHIAFVLGAVAVLHRSTSSERDWAREGSLTAAPQP